ncbi:cyclin-domain-containing protein [Massarina eburnea CBS 473.64]|uniref:Cyclin-domain-containing protein n=1 Tax=Massarina eburnea CBS 473.64 TaxID=1395130 RepID=A0A6A6S2K9_9PLEO|nr:cyclin-domain-containing protein [Massarina eburnea CBS 473.64]
MLTSSPTISAPPSPSAAFHSHGLSSYHAARRTHSPRFTVSSASSRRFDSHSASSNPTLSPVPAKRKECEYTDSATQYTPPGFPPTYHPPPDSEAATAAITSLPETAQTRRGESSAAAAAAATTPTATAAAATEPLEPDVRIDPQPVAPQHGQNRRPSGESQAENQSHQKPRQSASGANATEQASPAKRPRSLDENVKVMPLLYETCDIKDLGVLVSDMLMELVRLNDDMPLRDGQLTRFHSRAPPAISVKDYLFRLIVHATLSPPILLSMVFYVDKLCTMYPAFTISSLTVHRFLITAATVAAKGLSDSFWTNSLYAKVGGVSLRELALLEVEFLKRLEWRIVPKPETLVDYYKGLVERGGGYVLEREDGGTGERIGN